MAPASSTGPTKHVTVVHDFMKQQQLRQRPKPAVLWTWTAAAAAADDMGGTWPPRSYTCAFCRREFRSAQALGGHMNVHRRDRARMRGQYGYGAAAHVVMASLAEAPAGATAATEYALVYPVLNSNEAGAVLTPSGGDVPLWHDGNDENDKEIDLELRLGWP